MQVQIQTMSVLKMYVASFSVLLLSWPASSYEIPPNLKPFIEAPEGLALKADHGEYLSRIEYHDGVNYIWASKKNKDPFTRFRAIETAEGLLVLECDKEGHYVQVVDRRVPTDDRYQYFGLECIHFASVDHLGEWNKFQAFSLEGGEKVALKMPARGRFVKRVHLSHIQREFHLMAAEDYSVTEFSTLTPESASFFPTEYEILDLEFDSGGLDPDTYTPTVVDQAEVSNWSDERVVRTATVVFSQERTETTHWEHAFGIMLKRTVKAGLAAKLVLDVQLELTLSYDYKTGGSSSVTTSTEFSQKLEVPCASNTVTRIKLMVMKKEDAVIPFTAKIRKTYYDNDGIKQSRTLYESGTWTGVLFYKTYVVVESKEGADGQWIEQGAKQEGLQEEPEEGSLSKTERILVWAAVAVGGLLIAAGMVWLICRCCNGSSDGRTQERTKNPTEVDEAALPMNQGKHN